MRNRPSKRCGRATLVIVFVIVLVVCGTLFAAAKEQPTGRVSTIVDVDNDDLLVSPPGANWISYNGDYSGRRYSSLSKINAANINSLSLAWVFRATPGANINATIKSTPLVVNGVMYFTLPDHVWAVDARTGRQPSAGIAGACLRARPIARAGAGSLIQVPDR